MRRLAVGAFACLASAGGIAWSSALADDRGLPSKSRESEDR